MNIRTYKALLLLSLSMLLVIGVCHAGSGPGAMMKIAYHREVVRNFGQISFVLAVGFLYLQIRRCGFNKLAAMWFGILALIYFVNPGWHNTGFGGESGEREAQGAENMAFIIGLLLVGQIFASLRSFLIRKTPKPSTVQTESS